MPTLAPLSSALLVRYGLAAMLGLILIVGCSTSAPTMGATPTQPSTATPFPPPTATPTLAPTATPMPTSPETDREALVALYSETDGARWWRNRRNWLSNRPIGEWHGVTTDANGRVTELAPSNNLLSGEIPPELGMLTNLTGLGLDGNQLSGEIPPELGSLTNLGALRLGGNRFTGCIPVGLRDVFDNDLLDLGLPFCGG